MRRQIGAAMNPIEKYVRRIARDETERVISEHRERRAARNKAEWDKFFESPDAWNDEYLRKYGDDLYGPYLSDQSE